MEEDYVFEKTASTFLNDMKNNSYCGIPAKLNYNSDIDKMLILKYSHELDFRSNWNEVVKISKTIPLYAFGIFGHGSADYDGGAG